MVDTGATASLIHLPLLVDLGLDPQRDGRQVRIATASSVEIATKVSLTLLSILGQHRIGFSVVAHTLPEAALIDGLLGLDFLQSHILTLDFQVGSITLV